MTGTRNIRRLMASVALCLAAVGSMLTDGPPVAAHALTAGGAAATWGNAEEVPGTAALNQGGNAEVMSLSCASPGTCGAGGYYTDAKNHQQAFVDSENNGIWGTAEEVPGTALLNTHGAAQILSVSCASAGNCGAGGYYTKGLASMQAFVVSEKNGVWGQAEEVPGSQGLNAGGSAEVTSVSCVTPGSCSAGGSYLEGSGNLGIFVAAEKNGTWGKAQVIHGLTGLNAGSPAGLYSLSCASAGDCGAGGEYPNAEAKGQTFVTGSKGGRWGTAEKVAGTTGYAAVLSLSCPAAGDCTGGGVSSGLKDGGGVPFLAGERNGTWSRAEPVPGIATGDDGDVISVSCTSPGNCGAGGDYVGSDGAEESFVATQTNGVWGNAEEVPGTGVLNNEGSGQVSAVSCSSPGNCSAGGGYTGSGVEREVYVDTEANGVWGQAEEVPGMATLNTAKAAFMETVSCSAAGQCSAGGRFGNHSFESQAFVVNET